MSTRMLDRHTISRSVKSPCTNCVSAAGRPAATAKYADLPAASGLVCWTGAPDGLAQGATRRGGGRRRRGRCRGRNVGQARIPGADPGDQSSTPLSYTTGAWRIGHSFGPLRIIADALRQALRQAQRRASAEEGGAEEGGGRRGGRRRGGQAQRREAQRREEQLCLALRQAQRREAPVPR